MKPRFNKPFTRVLTGLAVFYLLLCVAGCALQRRLIYFPTRLAPEAAEQLAANEGFQPWRNRTGEIIGWKLPGGGASRGRVLIVHGNAGCAAHRGYLARPIRQATGFEVHVLEYPGYGARRGSPGMKHFLPAAEEALASLPDDAPVFVVGESLGTGVAAHLAKFSGERIAGLALFAPYNNLVSVGQRQMPFLPVRLLLRERFDPAEWLRDYRGPIQFVVAGADEVIPAALGRKLHDGYAGPKRLQVVAGAGHNDVAAQPGEWWREVAEFWRQNSNSVKAAR